MPKTISIMSNENDDDFYFGPRAESLSSENSTPSTPEDVDPTCTAKEKSPWQNRLSGKHQDIIQRTAEALQRGFQNKLSVHTNLMRSSAFSHMLKEALGDKFNEDDDVVIMLCADADEIIEQLNDAVENLKNITKMADAYPVTQQPSDEEMNQYIDDLKIYEETNLRIKQTISFHAMFHSIYSVLRNYPDITLEDCCDKYLAGFPIKVREERKAAFLEKRKEKSPSEKSD